MCLYKSAKAKVHQIREQAQGQGPARTVGPLEDAVFESFRRGLLSRLESIVQKYFSFDLARQVIDMFAVALDEAIRTELIERLQIPDRQAGQAARKGVTETVGSSFKRDLFGEDDSVKLGKEFMNFELDMSEIKIPAQPSKDKKAGKLSRSRLSHKLDSFGFRLATQKQADFLLRHVLGGSDFDIIYRVFKRKPFEVASFKRKTQGLGNFLILCEARTKGGDVFGARVAFRGPDRARVDPDKSFLFNLNHEQLYRLTDVESTVKAGAS